MKLDKGACMVRLGREFSRRIYRVYDETGSLIGLVRLPKNGVIVGQGAGTVYLARCMPGALGPRRDIGQRATSGQAPLT